MYEEEIATFVAGKEARNEAVDVSDIIRFLHDSSWATMRMPIMDVIDEIDACIASALIEIVTIKKGE